uniref:Uncharacterized protein n=1 Tax=Anopheles coluzzii TaxID=1518534 RepID=A0A6E8W1S5_ANOCL
MASFQLRTCLPCCLLLITILHPVAGLRSLKTIPIVKNVITQSNPKYLNASTVPHNTPSESKVDLILDVKRLISNLHMNFVLWVNVISGTLQVPLYNQTIDFCEFLKNPSVHPLGQIIHREVKRNGNMPSKCPIAANLYAFYGIPMSGIRLPNFFPEADFMLQVFIGLASEMIYDGRLYGTIKRIQCTRAARC